MRLLLRLLLACTTLAIGSSSANLVAHHCVYFIKAGEDTDVSFRGHNIPREGSRYLHFTVTDVLATDSVYEPSFNFCKHGRATARGKKKSTAMTNPKDVSTCKDGTNVIYNRSPNRTPLVGDDRILFVALSRKHPGARSCKGTVHLVNAADPAFVVSNFVNGHDDWGIVVGNGAVAPVGGWDRYSMLQMSRYVWGEDTVLNIDAGGTDKVLWHFKAPSKFLASAVPGGMAASYGGNLKFTLSSASGDFSACNTGHDGKCGSLPVVTLECKTCWKYDMSDQGLRLIYPLSALPKRFEGNTLDITIPLRETGGWLRDPENSNYAWAAPHMNEFVQVLQRYDTMHILGDYTPHYESVMLDNVRLEPHRDGGCVLPDAVDYDFLNHGDSC